MSVYPEKNCHLQLNSGQIILFRLKSHNFRTYFLYMIRYNNASRPVHDPHDPPGLTPIRVRPTINKWTNATQNWNLTYAWVGNFQRFQQFSRS